MTDLNKGKVASLTGNLLARKGSATPAGFVRVAPGESKAPDYEVPPPEAGGQGATVSGEQSSLAFGADFESVGSRGKGDGSDEGWAPLSQIVIRPHPYRSEETKRREPIPATPPPEEIGIEPSLLADGALRLPVTPVPVGNDDDVAVETPRVPPAERRNEPILVVPRVRHGDADESGLSGEPDEADGGEFEELAAPTLRPVEEDTAIPAPVLGAPTGARDGPDAGQRHNAEAAVADIIVAPTLGAPDTPASSEASEPQLRVGDEVARPASEPPADEQARDQPRIVAPVAARRREAKSQATPIIVPPIRIGELKAQARVIPTRARRRHRLAPVVLAVLALAVFLGVTWQAYRTSRDSAGGFASPVGVDGEPTIWATVDELGYAVSQIIGALTGQSAPSAERNAVLAERPDEIIPTPKFVPVGPIAGYAESAGVDASATTQPVTAEAEQTAPGQAGEGAPVAVAESSGTAAVPETLPPVRSATVAVDPLPSPEPLPAPPVPAPLVIATVPPVPQGAPRPVGVTAPPAPPLRDDRTASRLGGELFAAERLGREEVDTTVTLELPETASVAVAAGPTGESAVEDTVGATPAEAEIAALPAGTAAPALADSSTGVDVEAATNLSGVPVPKPTSRVSQQSLGATLAAVDTRAEGAPAADEHNAAADGYAVQLSSLKTKAQAEREFERLRADYPALLRDIELVVREGSVTNRGIFFRVLTSRFEDAGDARSLCEGLRDRGQDCLVVRR